MRATLPIVSIFLAGVLVSGAAFHQVSAQEEPVEQAPVAEIIAPVATLEEQYRQQLLDYQAAERLFTVAKGDYQQLGTLASLDKAVMATKAVYAARHQVLITYLELVRRDLSNALGIEEDRKAQALDQQSTLLAALQTNHEQAQQADDRFELRPVASSFDTISLDFQSSVYMSQSLLAIGRLQNLHDQIKVLIEEIDGVTEQEKNEMLLSLTQAQESLDKAKQRLVETKSKANSSTYTQTVQSIQPAFAKLRQVLGYMEEVRQS
jgi:hypothetical protein